MRRARLRPQLKLLLAAASAACSRGGWEVLMPYVVEFAFILIGFVLLVVGADKLVESASSIAARFGMPERVAGLTVVAIGTSLPELVVSITSAAAGHADMAFGNVVGSCLANLLLILGLSAVIAPVALSRGTIRFEIPVSVAACALLALLANTGGEVTRFEGVVLLLAFAAFLVRTTQMGLKEGADGLAGGRRGRGPREEAERRLGGVARRRGRRHAQGGRRPRG